MKYGLLDYSYTENGYVNIGDHIQSLAAKQFLPQVDYYIDREKLNQAESLCKIIMNGWYMHCTENWPPSENLQPLFVSFHLNPRAYDVLRNSKVVEYLKRYAPIGCRDYSTQRILEKYGIETYYSFCLTSTLGKHYSSEKRGNEIIFNDVLHKYLPVKHNKRYSGLSNSIKVNLKNLKDYPRVVKRTKLLNEYFPKEILEKAIHYEQDQDVFLKRTGLFQKAEEVLKSYSLAKCVATSRIHCAIPCIGMGTPVLFLLDGVDNPDRDLSRFDGILDHINILTRKSSNEIKKIFGKKMNTIHPEDVDWENPPQNPNTHIALSGKLAQTCEEFISQ